MILVILWELNFVFVVLFGFWNGMMFLLWRWRFKFDRGVFSVMFLFDLGFGILIFWVKRIWI